MNRMPFLAYFTIISSSCIQSDHKHRNMRLTSMVLVKCYGADNTGHALHRILPNYPNGYILIVIVGIYRIYYLIRCRG